MISYYSDVIGPGVYMNGAYGRDNMGGVVFHGLIRINLETCERIKLKYNTLRFWSGPTSNKRTCSRPFFVRIQPLTGEAIEYIAEINYFLVSGAIALAGLAPSRRGGRAVEGARLESVCRFTPTEGSNPSLSATISHGGRWQLLGEPNNDWAQDIDISSYQRRLSASKFFFGSFVGPYAT